MTLRLFVLGTITVVVVCAVVCWGVQVANLQLGVLQFPPPAIGVLLILVLVNRGLKAVGPRLRLTKQEIAGIYIMAMLATMVTSRGLFDLLIPGLVGLNYYAHPANKWAETFYPHMPERLVPWSPDNDSIQPVTRAFYEGTDRWDGWIEYLPQWFGPLAFWLVLAVLLFGAYYCLAAVMRKQWVDSERLSFPLVELPLELIRESAGEGESRFLGKPLTWYGFALPVIVFTLTGLHEFYPQIPALPTRGFTVNQWMPDRPWSAIYFTPIYLSFAAVGFFYFIPTQLLASLAFFFLFIRAQDVVLDAFGMPLRGMPLFPCRNYVGYQVMGAYCLLAGYWVHVSLPHLREVWRRATGRMGAPNAPHSATPDGSGGQECPPHDGTPDARHSATPDGSGGQECPPHEGGPGEMLPAPSALWGLVACFAGIIGWSLMAGLSWWMALLEFGVLIFVLAMVMTRSTAEAGLPMTEISFRPMNLFELFSPMHNIGKRNLTVLGLLDAIIVRDQRGLTLTAHLDGSKLGDGLGMPRKNLLPISAYAIALALVVGGVFQLAVPYNIGGVGLYPPNYAQYPIWEFQAHAPAVTGQVPYSPIGIAWFLAGVVVTAVTAWMRTHFAWWPLSPLAYAVSGSWTMIVFWVSIIIAWALKIVIFRYGGMKTFVKGRPFFLGMILGEFTSILGWSVVAFVTRKAMPIFAWW